jgi:hypothetical protein
VKIGEKKSLEKNLEDQRRKVLEEEIARLKKKGI